MRRWGLAGGTIALGLVLWVVAASVWTGPALASITVPCTTPGPGSCADFVIPSDVSSVTIEVWGADGGSGGAPGSGCAPTTAGRLGGYVKATYAVSADGPLHPGDTLHLYVGAAGSNGACGDTGTGGAGGMGGNDDANGGAGGAGAGPDAIHNNGGGGGGGGETDVRVGGTTLSDRIVVGAGGGGTGGGGGAGGSGGGSPGGHGGASGGGTANGGAGGTLNAAGSGGSGGGTGGDGSDGNSASGGAGGSGNDTTIGAGGGGGAGAGIFGSGGGEAGSNGDTGAGGAGGSGGIPLSSLTPTTVKQQIGVDAGNGGNGKIVITYTEPPQTGAATGVTATGATLVGYDENNDTFHFEYGTDTTYGTTTADAPALAGATLKTAVSGLTPDTTYHYRIDSSDSPVQGDDVTFHTLLLPVTGSASGVTASTATVQGTDPNAGESYHFEYGTTTAYGASTPAATNGGGTLSAGLTGLQPGATYHYRIVSDAGAGSDATFTTLGRPLTGPAASVTSTSAVLQGIDRNVGTSYHFEYGTTTAYGKSTAAAPSSGTSNFVAATVAGLSPGTKYHFRIVDSVGGAGLDGTFTTTAAGGGGGGGTPTRDLILGLRGPASGKVGTSLRYVATIGNVGTGSASKAKLKLSFRGGTIKVTYDRGCKRSRTTLTCALPKISAGHAVRVKVVVRESKATVLSVKGSLVTPFTDPTPKNNRASTHTTVK